MPKHRDAAESEEQHSSAFDQEVDERECRIVHGGGELRFTSLLDDGLQALEFVLGELAVLGIDERSDGVGEGAVEEGVEHFLQGGAAHLLARLSGHEDVARAVLAVLQRTLFLQDAQQGADGGVAGRIRQCGLDFSGGGFALGIDDVHDLPFPTAVLVVFGCHAGFLAYLVTERQELFAKILAC